MSPPPNLPLWRTQALVAAVKGRPFGTLPEGIGGISIDTRTLKPGDAFFAIRGERFDGHDFATAAVKAGAALMVVSEGRLAALGRVNVPLIVVPDVLRALEMAGLAARARTGARIIAVTGSVGKTTTKEALRHALAATGKVHAADRSFNNHWGVPLTLARMPEDCDYAVFEIGMNHPGEIRRLAAMVRPHIAIVTRIAPAHLGYFGDLEGIARAKAEIFEGVEAGGHAILNRDDPEWKLLDEAARAAGLEHVWGFGEHDRATFRLLAYEGDAAGSDIETLIAGRELSVRVGAPGRHIVQNALAVLGAAYLAGAAIDLAAEALGGWKAARGRGESRVLHHPGGTFRLVDESYNANPASMEAALDLLAATPVGAGGRRIAVLGDMAELGERAHAFHAGLAGPLSRTRPGLVLLFGEQMKALADKVAQDEGIEGVELRHFEDRDELAGALLDAVRPGDAVMIKASNSFGFSALVDALAARFPAPDADAPGEGGAGN